MSLWAYGLMAYGIITAETNGEGKWPKLGWHVWFLLGLWFMVYGLSLLYVVRFGELQMVVCAIAESLLVFG